MGLVTLVILAGINNAPRLLDARRCFGGSGGEQRLDIGSDVSAIERRVGVRADGREAIVRTGLQMILDAAFAHKSRLRMSGDMRFALSITIVALRFGSHRSK